MSELYISIRTRQADIIAQNKASIIISRTSRVDDGAGGWLETITNLPSQDVRIYFKGSRVYSVDTGGWHTARQTKMIAKYDADIEAENETFLDTFSHNFIDYKIKDVKPMTTQDYVVYKECTLEEIT